VFPVRYGLDFYVPEDGVLHSHRRENLKSYIISQFQQTTVVIEGVRERNIENNNKKKRGRRYRAIYKLTDQGLEGRVEPFSKCLLDCKKLTSV
jgi:hypothetical protein